MSVAAASAGRRTHRRRRGWRCWRQGDTNATCSVNLLDDACTQTGATPTITIGDDEANDDGGADAAHGDASVLERCRVLRARPDVDIGARAHMCAGVFAMTYSHSAIATTATIAHHAHAGESCVYVCLRVRVDADIDVKANMAVFHEAQFESWYAFSSVSQTSHSHRRRLMHLAELHAASNSALVSEQRSAAHGARTPSSPRAMSGGASGGTTTATASATTTATTTTTTTTTTTSGTTSRALAAFIALELPTTALAPTTTTSATSATSERAAQLHWARALATRVAKGKSVIERLMAYRALTYVLADNVQTRQV